MIIIETDEDCPFMGKTFEFSDETEIVPIASSFHFPNFNPLPRNASTISCSWSFDVSAGYKLKIHLKSLFFKSGQTLRLWDNHDFVFFNDTGIHYFEWSSFVLSYDYESKTPNLTRDPDFEFNGSEFGFSGIVTAVKSNVTKVNQKCTDKKGTFSNFNAIKGYEDNGVSWGCNRITTRILPRSGTQK